MSRPVCAETRSRIEPYLGGRPPDGDLSEVDLTASEIRSLERHLEECTDCARELEMARRVASTLRGFGATACPDSVVEAVFDRIDAGVVVESLERGFWQRRGTRTATRLLLAAGLLSAIVLVGLRLQTPSARAPSVRSQTLSPAYSDPAYSDAEIARAEEEARLAFAYLAAVTHRARETIRDDVIVDRILAPPRVHSEL